MKRRVAMYVVGLVGLGAYEVYRASRVVHEFSYKVMCDVVYMRYHVLGEDK